MEATEQFIWGFVAFVGFVAIAVFAIGALIVLKVRDLLKRSRK